MLPLATVYGRSVYGPDGAVDDHHVDTAVASLEQTRERLTTRHSVGQRFVAAYRPASIIPDRARQIAKSLRANRRNGNGDNSADRNGR